MAVPTLPAPAMATFMPVPSVARGRRADQSFLETGECLRRWP